MPWSPQFSSPCLQISKSPPNLRKLLFCGLQLVQPRGLTPDKSKAVTAAGMWSSTGARTESCCGSCVVRVLFRCALKKSLFLTNSAVCRLGPVYILHYHGPLTQFCSQKTTFLLVGGRGGQTHLLVFPLAAGAVGNCGVHVGVGFFSISFELLMQILALFSM